MMKVTDNNTLEHENIKSASGSSRRKALKFGFAAAFAARLAAPALASQSSNAEPAEEGDPFLVKYRYYLSLCRDHKFDPRQVFYDRMRADVVARYGEDLGTRIATTCGYTAVMAELDALDNARTDILIELMTIPPTTLAGFQAKTQLLVDEWRSNFHVMDEWDKIPYLVFDDALRFMGEEQLQKQT